MTARKFTYTLAVQQRVCMNDRQCCPIGALGALQVALVYLCLLLGHRGFVGHVLFCLIFKQLH